MAFVSDFCLNLDIMNVLIRKIDRSVQQTQGGNDGDEEQSSAIALRGLSQMDNIWHQ
jgi:hypothetical protein